MMHRVHNKHPMLDDRGFVRLYIQLRHSIATFPVEHRGGYLAGHLQHQCRKVAGTCCSCLADPASGDVGSNAQEAACPAEVQPSAGTSSSYALGQALVVQGDIPPAPAGVRVGGTFVLPVGVLSGECLDLQQVGFMQRLPSSLKVRVSLTLSHSS